MKEEYIMQSTSELLLKYKYPLNNGKCTFLLREYGMAWYWIEYSPNLLENLIKIYYKDISNK